MFAICCSGEEHGYIVYLGNATQRGILTVQDFEGVVPLWDFRTSNATEFSVKVEEDKGGCGVSGTIFHWYAHYLPLTMLHMLGLSVCLVCTKPGIGWLQGRMLDV